MKNKFLIWIGILLVISLIGRGCNSEKINPENMNQGDIVLYTEKLNYSTGQEVVLRIKNNTTENIKITNICPGPPLTILKYQNGDWIPKEINSQINCENKNLEMIIAAQQEQKLSYLEWKHALFSEEGRHLIQLQTEEKTYTSNEFIIEKESVFSLIWREFIYRPIYNTLVFFADKLPNHSLGLSIILLTIIIRSILLVPSQKALKAQKKLQEVQPKLQKIQKKYAGNQQKIAEETMKIWKEHKVNPLGSCLPILVQFPILIALFYVIKDVTNPDNTYLLYEFLKDFRLENLNVNFFNILDLTKVNTFILPLIVGGLQFIQIKLSLAKKQNKNNESEKKEKNETNKQSAGPDMEMMNKTMAYIMPVMIAVFTASVPSGVGLYWGTSTTYGIFQQIVVNKQMQKEKPEVKILS